MLIEPTHVFVVLKEGNDEDCATVHGVYLDEQLANEHCRCAVGSYVREIPVSETFTPTLEQIAERDRHEAWLKACEDYERSPEGQAILNRIDREAQEFAAWFRSNQRV